MSARPLELGTGEWGSRRLVQSTCGWIIAPCYKVAATSDPPLSDRASALKRLRWHRGRVGWGEGEREREKELGGLKQLACGALD